MNKALCVIIFILITSQAWTQTYNWGQSIGGVEWESFEKLEETSSGDLLRCGTFYNTVDFDPGVGVTSLTSNGNRDCYIEKIDTSGNLLWVKSIGGLGADHFTDMVMDSDENIYLFGAFAFTVDFNPGVGVENRTVVEDSDAFILKLDANGNFIWVKVIGGNDFESINYATIGGDNDIYFTGTYKDTTDFDPGVGVSELISNGMDDIFIQKIDTAGNLIWVQSFGGIDDDRSSQLGLDNNGYLYNAGHYEYTVDFDPGSWSDEFHIERRQRSIRS